MTLILLRDVFNWAASRLKLFEVRDKDVDRAIATFDRQLDLWVQYAREFAGETAHCPGAVLVSYLDWSRDADYRAGILARIGLPLRDNTADHVPAVGGGSSFDRTDFAGSAADMKTLERWVFLQEPRFAPVLGALQARRDVIEPLNARLFGQGWVL